MMLVLIVQKEQAEEQRQRARARWAEAQREGARVAALRGNLPEARAKIRGSLETEDSALARVLWWDVRRQPLVFRKSLNTLLLGVAFSPDGLRLATGGTGPEAITLWDTQGRERLLTLEAPASVMSTTAFSPDGNVLASQSGSGGNARVIYFWRAPSWTEIEAAEKAAGVRQALR